MAWALTKNVTRQMVPDGIELDPRERKRKRGRPVREWNGGVKKTRERKGMGEDKWKNKKTMEDRMQETASAVKDSRINVYINHLKRSILT